MKKTLRSSVLLVACLIVVSLVGTQATAEVVLSNRPWIDDNGACMGSNGTVMAGLRFTVPAGPDYVLNAVTVKVQSNERTGPPLQMTLHDDAFGSSQPGNVIATLGNQVVGPYQTNLEHAFPGGGAVLAGGSTYWIGLTVLLDSPCSVGWDYAQASPTGTFSQQGAFWNVSGEWLSTPRPVDIEIDAALAPDPIPALGGVGLAGLVLLLALAGLWVVRRTT